MKIHTLLLPILLMSVLLSGCIDNTSDDIDVENRLVGKKIGGSDGGTGHLEEQQEEDLFTLSLSENKHLTGMTVIVDWNDEPPQQSSTVYYNEGDQFNTVISDDNNLKKMGSYTNVPGNPGHLVLFLEGIIVDNQTIPQPVTYTISVKLLNAGDQYPYVHQSELLKVEDTGNDFSWSVFYEYIDKSL